MTSPGGVGCRRAHAPPVAKGSAKGRPSIITTSRPIFGGQGKCNAPGRRKVPAPPLSKPAGVKTRHRVGPAAGSNVSRVKCHGPGRPWTTESGRLPRAEAAAPSCSMAIWREGPIVSGPRPTWCAYRVYIRRDSVALTRQSSLTAAAERRRAKLGAGRRYRFLAPGGRPTGTGQGRTIVAGSAGSPV